MESTKQSILIVEDQPNEREALMRMLRVEGYHPLAAANVMEARAFLTKPVDLVITDLRLGRYSGLDLLRSWQESRPSTPFIVATAYGDIESAVNAMKLGAIDYLTKPLQPEHLLLLLNRYLPMRNPHRLQEESLPGLGNLIGNSPAMLRVFESIVKVADSDSIVLITGESGTGKELVAAAIHENSKRKNAPYVAVNIAAFPEALIEAELFGHVKGSFTGALDTRPGRFRVADSGTLFMDEIGDFPLALQPKLLRVLESFKYSPIGSNLEEQVDVRLIAATSRNIPELVENGHYRADLFHRLNVLAIDLPPLRERPEDIEALVQYFLTDCASRHMRVAPTVSSDLMAYLRTYDWPGNVRQLRNTIENMFVMGGREQLNLTDLPKFLGVSNPIESLRNESQTLNLADIEKTTILNALTQSMGNRTHAAQKLGISIRTLQRKLRQWNWDMDE